MALRTSLRILEIGRDPLFAVAYPDTTDWIPTGRPVEPLNRHFIAPRLDSVSGVQAARRLRRRDYDLVMVPAIQASTPTDQTRVRKATRRVLTRLAEQERLVNVLGTISSIIHTPHIVRDISDSPDIGETDAGLFPEARVYAKREVLVTDIGMPAHGTRGGTVTYVPMPFDIRSYQEWMARLPAKEVDVFFAGKLHSRHRMMARQAAEELERRGYRVDLPEERLKYGEYLQRVARSWLVLSPKGHGEHCYRHYESLLMGSVPVINEPERPVHYQLSDGETALFYEPSPRHLIQRCVDALGDREALRAIADRGRDLVVTHHDHRAIVKSLVELSLAS